MSSVVQEWQEYSFKFYQIIFLRIITIISQLCFHTFACSSYSSIIFTFFNLKNTCCFSKQSIPSSYTSSSKEVISLKPIHPFNNNHSKIIVLCVIFLNPLVTITVEDASDAYIGWIIIASGLAVVSVNLMVKFIFRL